MFSIAYGDQRKRGWVRKGSKFSALCDGFCIALRATREFLDSRCRSRKSAAVGRRGARTREGDSGLTPLVTMFSGARVSYDIPPTDSPLPKRNDRQKIELNVEILEGHLGCMKSTHSMNAATWGR
jgi:hypothetical protein